MSRFMNGYTLVASVVLLLVFINTLLRVLLNGPLVSVTLGLIVLGFLCWFIVKNVFIIIERFSE